ncbi:MAG: hypothetical protein NTV71_00035 [Candidatus Omnitrophica bacterium]|nr:hypothetical protein [Candidatus Omnitrophota bacterium]
MAIGCGFYIAGWATAVIAFTTLYLLRKLPVEEEKQ